MHVLSQALRMILMIASGQTKTNAANAALFDFLGGALFDCWLAQVKTRELQRANIAMIPTRNFLMMIAGDNLCSKSKGDYSWSL